MARRLAMRPRHRYWIGRFTDEWIVECVVFKNFGELSQSFQSEALIGLFNGSTECKKNKYGEARKTE